MLEPGPVSLLINELQCISDAGVRDVARGVEAIGGQEAVRRYLNNTQLTVLAIATKELGYAEACQLMAEGLITAEALEAQGG